ncbi:MAG: hemerythrin [Bacteroidetes bacterium]|jgi:iron-sulfur cluster repair protein YtfE (RIC family)|nr:hemerythrin [Bacteroidota bacterium]
MAVRRSIDPIARFLQEHDATLMQLSALNRATRTLADQGYSDDAMGRVRTAVQFLAEEVGDHNTREEEALFPVLERYVEGPTHVMREEHKELKRELRKLQTAARAVRSSRVSTTTLRTLRARAQTVIQRFVNHIHKENHILFPLVQKFLTRDALREIARRMV